MPGSFLVDRYINHPGYIISYRMRIQANTPFQWPITKDNWVNPYFLGEDDIELKTKGLTEELKDEDGGYTIYLSRTKFMGAGYAVLRGKGIPLGHLISNITEGCYQNEDGYSVSYFTLDGASDWRITNAKEILTEAFTIQNLNFVRDLY